jgi:hypothetical protein
MNSPRSLTLLAAYPSLTSPASTRDSADLFSGTMTLTDQEVIQLNRRAMPRREKGAKAANHQRSHRSRSGTARIV